MALWNKVLSGFDAEDETVNFGARTVAESHDSVYETTTLATIQADGQVVNNPAVFASIYDSTLCVTIDKSITVFADQSCREIRLCVGFNSPITSHCLSKNFNYLFVTLTNGGLYCLNIDTGGRVVFHRNVIQRYDTCGEVIVKVFVNRAEQNDSSDLLLVTSRGRIFGVYGFSEKVMDAVLDVEDTKELGNLTQDVRCRLLETENRAQQVTSAEVNTLCGQLQSVVMIGREIYVWPSEQFCSLIKFTYEYKKVQYLKNSSYYLCLRTDGALNLVCAATLLARKVWHGPAVDMVIAEDEADGITQILVLLKPEEGSSTTFIQLVSFPDFQVKFNLQVATTTYLVDQDGGSIDEILFLEGAGETLDAIDTVKIKTIEENLPECRLQRLLRRGKYDEAKIFAKQFHLSTDIIYCAKASSLTKQISFSTNENDVIRKINELIETLDDIKNVELVFGYCHNTVTSDLEQTKRLITYARERLIKDAEKNNDELIAAHLVNLNSTLYRIETHEMICRTRENNAEGISEWIRFSKSDLLSECKSYLMHGELKVAALIWVRHSSSLLASVRPEVVRDILGMIPGGLSQSHLWPWLYHFVPSILFFYPDGLSEIVTWGYKRAKSFENFDKSNWPKSGLEFCKSFMKLLNFEESQSFFHLNQQYNSKHSPLQRLTAVIQALTDLQHLKENYRFVVKIDSYMGEPIEVAHLLLHEVRAQEISNFVDTFLRQYMLNHSMQNDDVLILYIQKLLKKSKGWWFTQQMADAWEEKISSVIGCIHNVESRLQQTLETLRKAYVPWSSTMQELVENSISVKHSLVAEIITERNSVATKLILKRYGFQHVGVTDNLIKRIIKENRDEMLEDLYELTKTNNSMKIRALSICVNFFLNEGDLDRTMTVIKNLSNEDAIYCCKQIIHYVGSSLSFKEMNNTAVYYAELIGAVQSKLKSIILSSSGSENYQLDDILATASELRSICLLRQEFGINLTLTEYQSRTETVLKMHLQNLYSESNNKKLSSFLPYKKALRIADLLKWPRILAVCLLLENSLDTEILKHYIQGIQGTGSIPAEECPYVKRLCRICIFDLKSGELEALGSLKDISSSALENCSVGELSQTLLTTVWTHLSHRITTTEAIGLTDMRNGLNADTVKWRLYNIYTDTAMGSGKTIIPFCIQAFKFSSMCTDEELLKDDEASVLETRSNQLADLIAKVKAIQSESYNFPMLQILNNLLSTCCSSTKMSEEFLAVIEQVRFSCLYMLLQKIISARRFDLQSGLSCLAVLSEQEAFKWLTSTCQMYQTDYSRLRAVSDLGHAFAHLMKNKAYIKYFTYYQKCHYWAKKLSAHGINQKEILTSHTEGKQAILERLMRSEKSGFIELLKEYCKDFEFDIDECYILYLDVLLKQWNPTIKIVTLNSEKELKINQDEIATLHKTCKQVAALIEDKSAMQKHLVSLWPKINFYHYEVFLLIMEILDIKNEIRFDHLCFLQNYVRCGSPTQIEYDEWSQISPEDNTLPPISKWRFPFLPTVDQWKLITPELNLSTYEKWMEVAPILKLQKFVICSLAIKGGVNQVWMSSKESKKRNPNEWLINSKNSTLLKDIKACLNHMSDKEALEHGTAALYYVVNHTPAGADQAAAAQECYAFAQKWAQASVNCDKGTIEKIKYKYLQLTAKHILHTHDLGSDRYLQLVNSPERLVRELYMDESIVLRSRGATEHRPDINSAVNMLGKIFSLNVIQLRLELLEEWLQPNDGNCKLDDSMSCNIAALTNRTEDNGTDDDNLLRACYILEWGDKTMSANYLINIGFGENHETSFRPGIQFRALHVLLSITDSATVQDLTKRDLRSIKQYMKSLQYVSELEKLGFTFSVHRFETASKLELAQALFRGHANVPEALVLILQICVDFQLNNYTLWDGVLTKMARMYMIKELGKFLPKVSTVSHAVGCNGYIQGWEVLILDPFRRSDAFLSQEQFDDCISSICLLHSCPVSRKLDLKPIINTCFQSRHPELAAVLLPFVNDNDATFILQKIRSSSDVAKIIKDLRALSSRQILTISYSVRMLEEFLESDASRIR